MTSIKQLVDRGLELRGQIKSLKSQLGDIETKLSAAGLLKEQVPLKDEDREGRRFLARGTLWIVPVIYTADKVVKSFQHEGPMHGKVAAAAAGRLADFFGFSQVWENRFNDGREFRQQAAALLGGEGPAFVSACLARDKHGIPKSDIRISWDDAEAATVA